jgi:hypothetical protein
VLVKYQYPYIRDVHELVPSLKLKYSYLLYQLSLYKPTFSHYTKVEFAFICFASRNKLNKVLNHKPVQWSSVLSDISKSFKLRIRTNLTEFFPQKVLIHLINRRTLRKAWNAKFKGRLKNFGFVFDRSVRPGKTSWRHMKRGLLISKTFSCL